MTEAEYEAAYLDKQRLPLTSTFLSFGNRRCLWRTGSRKR
jgi:hypothetical protein